MKSAMNTMRHRFDKNGQPMYRQLAEILQAQIDSGQYKPGDRLPTENEVAQQFGVSLITVRTARQILVEGGLVTRHSGKGSFVLQKPALITYRAASRVRDLYALGGDLETLATGQHHDVRRELLRRTTAPADPRTAELLQLHDDRNVIQFHIRMYINEVPLNYLLAAVPPDLGRQIPPKLLGDKALVLVLSEICRVKIAKAEQWIMAAPADSPTAQVLNLRIGDPVLIIQRLFFDSQAAPVLFSTNTYRGDQYRQHTILR